MLASTVTALLAAALFAVTTNLQRAAASTVDARGSGPLHLVCWLLGDPRWLTGWVVGCAAFTLHSVALGSGSVMVVQSVMALGLLVTLALEAMRERRPLCRRELGGAVLVVGGVALVVGVAGPMGAATPDGPGRGGGMAALVFSVFVACATLGLVARSRHGVGRHWEARVLAAAAGACFAVDAVFLRDLAILAHSALGGAGPPPSMPPPSMPPPGTPPGLLPAAAMVMPVLVGLAGFLGSSAAGGIAVHRAYQVAPLRAVQPAAASAEPVTAFIFGVALLHQGLRGGAAAWGCGVGLRGGAAGWGCGVRSRVRGSRGDHRWDPRRGWGMGASSSEPGLRVVPGRRSPVVPSSPHRRSFRPHVLVSVRSG